jgi:hypothetical protein
MIGDIAILVPSDRLAESLAALHALGYLESSVYEPGHNAYGELARQSAPAMLDIHVAPVDTPHLLPAREIWEGARLGPEGAQRRTGIAARTADQQRLRWHLHDLWPEQTLPGSALFSTKWGTRIGRRLARADQSDRRGGAGSVGPDHLDDAPPVLKQ